MTREAISQLPLYPEERKTRRPTAEQILRLFSLTERHTLQHEGQSSRSANPARGSGKEASRRKER